MSNYIDEINKVDEEIRRFKPTPISELLTKQFPPIPWLVEQLIPAEGITVLSGLSGVGKTWLELVLIHSISTGVPFLNKFQTRQGKVLLVGEEDSEQFLQQRWKILGYDSDPNENFWLLIRSQFDIFSGINDLLSFSEVTGITLVCFDTFRDIFTKDENDSAAISSVIKQFRALNKQGVGVLVTHHHRKDNIFSKGNPAQTLRGSSALYGSIDTHLYLKDCGNNGVQLTQVKSRVSPKLQSFKIDKTESEGTIRFEYAGEVEEKLEKKEEAKNLIAEILTDTHEADMKELSELIAGRCGKTSLEDALKELADENLVYKYRKQGKGNKFFYSMEKPATSDNFLFS
jgi:predicted transcriptional regulator